MSPSKPSLTKLKALPHLTDAERSELIAAARSAQPERVCDPLCPPGRVYVVDPDYLRSRSVYRPLSTRAVTEARPLLDGLGDEVHSRDA